MILYTILSQYPTFSLFNHISKIIRTLALNPSVKYWLRPNDMCESNNPKYRNGNLLEWATTGEITDNSQPFCMDLDTSHTIVDIDLLNGTVITKKIYALLFFILQIN